MKLIDESSSSGFVYNVARIVLRDRVFKKRVVALFQ